VIDLALPQVECANTRKCSKCGSEKAEAEFYANAGSVCKACRKERSKAWRAANPDKMKALNEKARAHRKATQDPEVQRRYQREWRAKNAERHYFRQRARTHGLTLAELRLLEESAGGVCEICKKHVGELHIDHDHTTGKVRGMLCGSCNRALGLFHEDVEALRSAIAYLQERGGGSCLRIQCAS
jgi:hypothetical protein